MGMKNGGPKYRSTIPGMIWMSRNRMNSIWKWLYLPPWSTEWIKTLDGCLIIWTKKELPKIPLLFTCRIMASCPYDSNRDFDFPPGAAEGFRTLCAAWANAGNTPFRYFKQYGHEGGTHTHFIVRWPEKVKPGSITRQTGHIVDVAPTLLEAAGVNYPERLGEITPQPLQGSSLMPVLLGGERENSEFFMSGWTDRFRMFRQGDFKIVRANGEAWELYNLKDDPTEINDLAGEYPEKVEELEKAYNIYIKNTNNK